MMPGQITINYGVMDHIIGDIRSLASMTASYAACARPLGKCRGVTATNLTESSQEVAQFARALSMVMSDTARLLAEAKERMRAEDEGLATQFDGSAGHAKGVAPEGENKPKSARLSDCVEQKNLRDASKGSGGGAGKSF